MSREDIEDFREKLRASNRELLADIERREIDIPYHKLRPEPEPVIYKTYDNAAREDDSVVTEPPPFSEAQVDIVSRLVAMVRSEMRDELAQTLAPLRERLARCEGALVGMASSEAKAAPRRTRK
jgi:hypothetical protein